MRQPAAQWLRTPDKPLTPFRQLWSQTSSPPRPRSIRPRDNHKEHCEEPKVEVIVSTSEKWCNFIGCIVAAALYFGTFLYSDYLWSFDRILAICLAEYCGWSNERSSRKSRREEQSKSKKSANPSPAENGGHLAPTNGLPNCKLGCIAAVVGYREDPVIFTKALQSYLQADGCRFVLICIDGNDPEDEVMVDIFQKVYPTNSAVLNLSIPLVEIALQMDRDKPKWMPDAELITKCVTMAKHILLEDNIHVTGPDAISRLCVTQPHMHKKGILFTSFVISLALSELLDVDFLWTSDSDSMVYKETLKMTIQTIDGDDKCAGASTALTIHNRDDSLVTTLGNGVYLNELHLSRCFSSAVGSNDCQSGPCAAFRIKAIRPELLAWYKQTIWGQWMIVNEDRHMTTRLLLPGYRIRYISHAATATETPVSLRRWLLQQVRWARAVHIESYVHPTIYLTQPPLFFFAALRRQITSFLLFTTVISYFFTGVSPFLPFSPQDYVLKFLFTAVYLLVRNPIHPTWEELIWSVPANLFYLVPLPAIQTWSFITMLAGGWGTSMRGVKEMEEKKRWRELKKKAWEVGFFVVWMGVVGGVVGRWISWQAGLDARGCLLCMGVGMTGMWGGFGYWMVVAE